jgi:membrane protein
VTVDQQQAEQQPAETSAPAPEGTVARWRKAIEALIARVMAIPIVSLGFEILDTAGRAGAPLFSAALAFSTLFALFPLLLLFAGILGYFVEDPAQRSALIAQVVSIFPPIEDLLSTSLESVVNQRGTLTIVGLVGLLWGASSFYAALDESMRRLFAGPRTRDFFQYRIRGVVTVVVLIGLMVATLVITSVLSFVSTVAGGELLLIATPLGALAVMIVVVLAIYLFVPTAPPSLRDAYLPAIVAGTGIGLLTSLFGVLAPWLVGGLLAFGVIATVFAALIWLNLSYQILLYGAAWARIRRDKSTPRHVQAATKTPYAD